MDIKELSIHNQDTIKKALQVLDKTGLGVIFIQDVDGKLVGLLTDGDIRRALIGDAQLNSPVELAMNRNFTSLPVETENKVILDNLTSKVKIIPLTDANGILVDYASINRLRRISVASPVLNGNELLYITDCVKTNWISSQGKYVRAFENSFEKYHGGRKSLAVSNGTVALHLALDALGITKGDEVLVADFTFAASVNAIIYTGATPVLVDIEKDTWNIDVKKIEQYITPNTRAIMPVHIYGHPCNMDAIVEIAKRHNLLIIEDCAEALGSLYAGKPVGTYCDAATYSFFGNKTITTGEGGMVVFKDERVAERAAVLRDHGMEKNRRYWHTEVGYNYRLTNLQAAVGVGQFERLDEFVVAKRVNADTYSKAFADVPYFQLPIERDDSFNSFWMYTLLVNESAPFTRDDLIHHLNLKGIETRPVFFPIHQMPPYVNFGKPEELTVSKWVSAHGLSLPSSVNLTTTELMYICQTINSFVADFKAVV
ncbi:aminotransferase class I/II-fold pyridoxal phosphate-dependent enzyme [Mucilaginibacter ximonensis]|uniref:Aminotransferase class I/II-fold pyridoxal phosphate-dependent enzyme n=1 Tax=Mucilaginibacter ximonensis TaxID=538021 RepID=A0ABW5YB65_9SPHI